ETTAVIENTAIDRVPLAELLREIKEEEDEDTGEATVAVQRQIDINTGEVKEEQEEIPLGLVKTEDAVSPCASNSFQVTSMDSSQSAGCGVELNFVNLSQQGRLNLLYQRMYCEVCDGLYEDIAEHEEAVHAEYWLRNSRKCAMEFCDFR
ncbi:hypothetical protein PFISCL1PPCAC_4428, partial [Pristionchus fissidentatus]